MNDLIMPKRKKFSQKFVNTNLENEFDNLLKNRTKTTIIISLLIFIVSLYIGINVLYSPLIIIVGLTLNIVLLGSLLKTRYIKILGIISIEAVITQIILSTVPMFSDSYNVITSLVLWLICISAVIGFYNNERYNRSLFITHKEIKDLNKRLKYSSLMDPLTRLYNKQFFLEVLQAEFSVSKRLKKDLCIAKLDIDHFRKINDELGLTAGDSVLAQVSTLMKETFRESDICARYYGEEFVILFNGTNLDSAKLSMERFLIKIRNQDFINIPWSITCSAGIVQLQSETICHDLIEKADKLLYRSKHMGRNCVTV